MIKILKIIVLSVVGLGLVFGLIGYFVIMPKEDRKECASRALDYIKKQSEEDVRYSDEKRDNDYIFVYEYCLNSKGYK